MKHWTAAERSQIAVLLQRKLTAAQIAKRYQGRSRSAVIGFVNRDPMLAKIGFQHRATLDKGRGEP